VPVAAAFSKKRTSLERLADPRREGDPIRRETRASRKLSSPSGNWRFCVPPQFVKWKPTKPHRLWPVGWRRTEPSRKGTPSTPGENGTKVFSSDITHRFAELWASPTSARDAISQTRAHPRGFRETAVKHTTSHGKIPLEPAAATTGVPVNPRIDGGVLIGCWADFRLAGELSQRPGQGPLAPGGRFTAIEPPTTATVVARMYSFLRRG